ncbi:hypothetical protein [Modestobacter sp. VKM Ac-2978]|uniref:hypothetical protein n=1 Tax=Modestobacter sp. VKM Ac-2978 TaxID=3004132 RepID=UPI0022AA941F|nr:hypothetical protein [Modestobacter sp. VKM Ac-2978]MCZ2850195.1 hypothetical protein [Modestobacter sp. VKM Ac-2978]
MLLWIAKERGVSREQALRDLLDAHVAEQSGCAEGDRLSHISTVLHYPPRPPGRQSDGRVRLSLRLDEGVAELASSMSLRLPGQALRRAFEDYASRPLTDAVVTAIARARPFVDEGLEGLPPLLRQRETQGLWRLTVAATLTLAEQQVVLSRPTDPTTAVLRGQDVAWHDPWRFAVALHLARRLLIGPQSAASRHMLWEQGDEFELLRFDFERTEDFDHPLLRGLSWPHRDLQGRGGAAVWRAERSLALERFATWMTGPTGTSTTVDPPEWEVTVPEGWHGRPPVAEKGQLSSQEQADVDAGRLVHIEVGDQSVLWPYGESGSPVRGIDAVGAGAGSIAPAELVELILIRTEDVGRRLRVPAATACELGFIPPAERDALVVAAEVETHAEIARVLTEASEPELWALRAAAHAPERFARIARRAGMQCFIVRPTWTWYVDSVPEVLAAGASREQLLWLGGGMRRLQRMALEDSMRSAALRAYWLGQPDIPDDM